MGKLVVTLKYGQGRERVISGIKRVSKPGRAHLRLQGPPPARPRRHGHGHPVHLDRHDHRLGGRPARASVARSWPSCGSPMSRIGRRPIDVPAGVEVVVETGRVAVSGPRGSLQESSRTTSRSRSRTAASSSRARPTGRSTVPCTGWCGSLVANMVTGVTAGYEKRLEIQGVGYRANPGAATSSSPSATPTPSR